MVYPVYLNYRLAPTFDQLLAYNNYHHHSLYKKPLKPANMLFNLR